jgi:uncharacterized protein (DUF1697 family)
VPTFVALIRAINLGTNRRVGMADLRAGLEEAGYDDVATHLQSGNVVLRGGRRGSAAVAKSIEGVIRRDFGFDADVIVRSAAELTTVIKANPFLKPRVDPSTLHVAFLKSAPTAAAVRKVGATDFGRDQFAIKGVEVYLRYHAGQARSRMSGTFFEKALGRPATIRTWNVVTKLGEIASGHG